METLRLLAKLFHDENPATLLAQSSNLFIEGLQLGSLAGETLSSHSIGSKSLEYWV